jgi:hypothetical protein
VTNQPNATSSAGFTAAVEWRRARRYLAGICLLAAFKTAAFCVLYPYFTNVDETFHYDAVVKYGRGVLPRPGEPLEEETATLQWRYAAWEYLFPPEARQATPEEIRRELAVRQTAAVPPELAQRVTQQVHQPPLYYALAGGLHRASVALGVPPRVRPFVVRLLNVGVAVAVVLASWRLARQLFPENVVVVYGAPLMVALFPQDVFYQVSNDGLSAAVCGWTVVWLLPVIMGARLTTGRALLCGGAVAAAILTKWTNAPIVLFLFAAVWATLVRQRNIAGDRRLPALILMLALAVLPVAAWCWRCQRDLGDLTGTAASVALLGWRPLPMRAWLEHPLFTLRALNPFQTSHGLNMFLFETCVTYWRGEFTWYLEPLRSVAVDWAYYAATLLGGVGCVLAIWRAARGVRYALVLCVLFALGALVQLIVLSIRFDFGDSYYPSREMPYFVSGRLMLGTLAVFAVLFVAGIDAVLRRLDGRMRLGLLSFLLAASLVADAVVSIAALGAAGSLMR